MYPMRTGAPSGLTQRQRAFHSLDSKAAPFFSVAATKDIAMTIPGTHRWDTGVTTDAVPLAHCSWEDSSPANPSSRNEAKG